MKRWLKQAALCIPAIKRIYDERDLLMAERDALFFKLDRRERYHYQFISKIYGESLEKADFPFLAGHERYLCDLERNLDSFVSFDRLGQSAPYKKTYTFNDPFINDNHKYYAECPTGLRGIETNIDIGIDGYLQAADALKLYELAYYCNGDVLELGTHKGLSTSILCQALFDSQSPGVLETDDACEETTRTARENLSGRPGVEKVRFHVMDANVFMDRFISQGRDFSLVFIDHWHGYQSTFEAAERAKHLLNPGGFICFHDYVNPENYSSDPDYGVYQAVVDSIMADKNYTFFGVFGCCGLYRKIGG